MKVRFVYFSIICLLASQAVAAQNSSIEILKADIPEGYTLVEMPAVFETISEPVLFKANESVIVIPPAYETSIKNGVVIKREISPERGMDRLIAEPFRTKVRKRVKEPARYILKNEKGDAIKQWGWVQGQLTEIK